MFPRKFMSTHWSFQKSWFPTSRTGNLVRVSSLYDRWATTFTASIQDAVIFMAHSFLSPYPPAQCTVWVEPNAKTFFSEQILLLWKTIYRTRANKGRAHSSKIIFWGLRQGWLKIWIWQGRTKFLSQTPSWILKNGTNIISRSIKSTSFSKVS